MFSRHVSPLELKEIKQAIRELAETRVRGEQRPIINQFISKLKKRYDKNN